LQNGGGISAGNYFSMDKFVDRPGVLGPPWSDSGWGAKGREEHGELSVGLTGARAALWRPGDGGAEPGGGDAP
jgi:hypothetical protein